jgi:hypothetical protein
VSRSNELENRKAAEGFRGFCDRVPGTKRRALLCAKKSHLISWPGWQRESNRLSTRLSPIQKFRWVHFPRNAEMEGAFTYRVTPVFMSKNGELSYSDFQDASIELRRETYPGLLNVTFTRGFVSSQAFVDKFVTPIGASAISQLLPLKADEGLDFKPTHPKADEALAWMGFEARSAVIELHG